MSIKDLKPRMFCTAQDVRDHHLLLTETVILDSQIEFFIFKATEDVKMHLYVLYTANSLIASSWCGITTPKEGNTGSAVLYGASAGTSAYTELWTVTCATSAFSVTGNLQGSFSNCAYSSNFTSASDMNIPASAWNGTPTAGDIFYIRTYDIYPSLVAITSMLAAGYVLKSKYTEEVPNANSESLHLVSRAESILKRLADPHGKDGLAIDTSAMYSMDFEPVAVPYEIDPEGVDVTEYYPDRNDQEGEEALADD